jgi:uncharacterized membrane protein
MKVKLRVRGPAYLALALGVVGLGICCLAYGDFVPQWQPVPPWFPWRHSFAYASGAVLLGGGVCLLVPRLPSRAALALTAYDVIWFAAEAQRGAGSGLTSVAHWLGFFEGIAEALAAAVGCFMVSALLVAEGAAPRLAFLGSRRSIRTAQVLFGASCIAFGLSHFAYADFTAGMIPRWFPARTGLVYLTGICHIAAGLAIITTVLARLAATLEALMLGIFVLVVHLPSFASSPRWAPSLQIQATELCLSLLIACSAGVVATSFPDRR